ncbi:double-cubane-cluster-containing anaerobic reductase [Tissierella sp. MB52-C2]|uniref:double-cubane-cluster-containing anaerobic reductase n=1 Tax=Tissierella sp. MB52-C2 TaxID=3070999 RepID=UPI00280B183F|nr:double-cubane-cluster-containing anaerobic reductase [Tissierella sp. MB52-C2]WMM24424.1 double-cubane-cluster-containing anaerobic reductase [Tissierella sp. MB52-C2]
MEQIKKIVERFINARSDLAMEIAKLKDQEVKIIGTYCSFAPEEIILAANAKVIRMCNTSDEYVIVGEKVLPSNICNIVKSSYGEALSDSPYFNAVDLVIGETTCDGKKKMYEYLESIKPTYVLQLPQKNQGSEESSLWRNEIQRLRENLEKQFNIEILDEKIREAIKIKNTERKTLKNFYESWIKNTELISSKDVFTILTNFGYRLDNEKALEDIKTITEIIKSQPKLDNKGKNNAPRILLTGCPLGQKMERIIGIIEEAGGNLICLETCDWMKDNQDLINEDIDPIDAIAEKYLQIPCPAMTPNNRRMNLISELIDKYNIDGVIDLSLQACLTFGVETVLMKRFITEEKNIGYLNLETNITAAEIGQLRTRIEAFMEIL